MLRLAADENFNGDIVRGLLRRQPTLDVVRVISASDQQLRHITLDANLTLARSGLGQVVGGLHPQPDIRRGTKRLRKADGHIRRYAGLAVDEARERCPADAEDSRSFGHREVERVETIVPDRQTGMRRIFHGHTLVSRRRGFL